MARRDLSTRDISDHAAGELEYALTKEKADADEPKISVEQAMAEKPVFQASSHRDVTRVLFISTDVGLLNPTTQSLDGYVEISDLFEEVHILVLRIGIDAKNPVLRAADNVWIYTASAQNWWQLPAAGMKMVDDQLSFASGFRPDLVVARDPIESAWLARRVVKKYGRPAQLHIMEDVWSRSFREKTPGQWCRRLVPYFTIGFFKSIRTATDTMAKKVAKRFTIPDLKALPRLQNYEALITATTNERLADKYHGLGIFLIYIGAITQTSGVFAVLEAARYILRNQRIGLVIVGNGDAKAELLKQAKQMGIERQVVVESGRVKLLPYLKGGHMLIVPQTDEVSEKTVLKGAAAGIPLLVAETEKREDVFDDKYSAYFVNPKKPETITNGISDLLNDVEGRAIMAKNAQTMITKKFHFDPTEYETAYRSSIEEALFTEFGEDDEV